MPLIPDTEDEEVILFPPIASGTTFFPEFDIPANLTIQNMNAINDRIQDAVEQVTPIIASLMNINFDAGSAALPVPAFTLTNPALATPVTPTPPTSGNQFGTVAGWTDPGYQDQAANAGITTDLALAPGALTHSVGTPQFPNALGALDMSGAPVRPPIRTSFDKPTPPPAIDRAGKPEPATIVDLALPATPADPDMSGEPTAPTLQAVAIPTPPTNVVPPAPPPDPTLTPVAIPDPPADIDIGALPTKGTLFALTMPTPPSTTIEIGPSPDSPTLTPVTLPTPPTPAVIPDAPGSPTLVTMVVPTAPGPIDTSGLPSRPDVTPPTLPPVPTLTMPPDPVFIELNLPLIPAYTVPTFDATKPEFDGVRPTDTFNWIEPTYVGPLLPVVEEKVRFVLAGNTALSTAVQNALVSVARDREAMNAQAAIETASDELAGRGFTMPALSLQRTIITASENALLEANAASRDVFTKVATMTREDIMAAIQHAISIETMVGGWFQAAVGRSFEAAKYHLDVEIKLYESAIALFNARQTAYQVEATVFGERIKAELGKLEVLKAQIEGEMAKGQINDQRIKLYLGQLEGVKALISVFDAQTRGAQAIADTNRAILEGFGSEVKAYHEIMDARKVPFEVHSEQVKALQAIGQFNQSLAQVHESEVRAFAAELAAQELPFKIYETETRGAQAIAEVNRQLIEGHVADIQAFIAKISAQKIPGEIFETQMRGQQAIASINQSITSLFESEIRALAQTVAVKRVPLEVWQDRIKGEQIKGDYNHSVVSVFEAKIRAWVEQLILQKLPVDIWSKLVDGQRTIADVNRAQADVFGTQARAHQTNIETRLTPLKVFDIKTRGVEAQSRINHDRVEIQSLQTQVWREGIAAQKVGFEVYGEQVKDRQLDIESEKLILDTVAVDVKLWDSTLAARMKAWETQRLNFEMEELRARAREAETRDYVEQLRGTSLEKENKATFVNLRLAEMRASSELYSARLQAERDRLANDVAVLRAKIEGFVADTGRFRAEIEGQNETTRLNVEVLLGQLRNAIAVYEITIKEYDAAMQRQQHRSDQVLEATRAAAQYTTAMVTSFASSMHFQSGVSASGSAGVSTGYSHTFPEGT